MKEKTLKNKEQRGITLIALVITVVIILILSAIVLSSLSGQNGIIGKAENAKEEHEEQANEEEKKIKEYEKIIAANSNGSTGSGYDAYVWGTSESEYALILDSNRLYVLLNKGKDYAAYYDGAYYEKDDYIERFESYANSDFFGEYSWNDVANVFYFGESLLFSSDGSLIGSSMEGFESVVPKTTNYDLEGFDFSSVKEGN